MLKRAQKPHFDVIRPRESAQNRHRREQKTPTEDYILCAECEKRFEFLETYIAGKFFHRYKNPSCDSEFMRSIELDISSGVMLRSNLVDLQVMKLFVYSILWRVTIATKDYANFDLPVDIKEGLRQQLNLWIAYTSVDLVSQAQSLTTQGFNIPYDIHVCPQYPSPNTNWIGARDFIPGKSTIAFIAANEFHFYFYIEKESGGRTVQRNSDAKVTLVTLIPDYEWHRVLNVIKSALLGH